MRQDENQANGTYEELFGGRKNPLRGAGGLTDRRIQACEPGLVSFGSSAALASRPDQLLRQSRHSVNQRPPRLTGLTPGANWFNGISFSSHLTPNRNTTNRPSLGKIQTNPRRVVEIWGSSLQTEGWKAEVNPRQVGERQGTKIKRAMSRSRSKYYCCCCCCCRYRLISW